MCFFFPDVCKYINIYIFFSFSIKSITCFGLTGGPLLDFILVMGSGFLSFPSLDSRHVNPTQPNCGVTSPTTHYMPLLAFPLSRRYELRSTLWFSSDKKQKNSKILLPLLGFVKNTLYLMWNTKSILLGPQTIIYGKTLQKLIVQLVIKEHQSKSDESGQYI